MAKITNWDDLRRMHDFARIAKPGSKVWIEFADTMIDSFPAMYDMAKAMNQKIIELQPERDIDIDDGA